MAFAVIETTNNGGTASSVNNFDVPLPSGIVSGDLLLLYIAILGINRDVNTPTGYTKVFNHAGSISSIRMLIFTRTADGTEGSTQNFTNTQFTNTWATASYRISGAEHDDVEAGFFDGASASTIPDPPSLTTSWGSDDNLWFAGATHRGTAVATAFSTGFSNGITNSFTSVGVSMADRSEAIATKDPGTLTIDDSQNWVGITTVVRPEIQVSAEPAIFFGANF